MKLLCLNLSAFMLLLVMFGCGDGGNSGGSEGQAAITLDPPASGATRLSGSARNVDYGKIKVVIWVLTDQWWVQPYQPENFTSIAADFSWTMTLSIPNWQSIVALLVDPSTYTAEGGYTNPALDPSVIAWTQYPSVPVSVNFSNRTWGIKMTGNMPSQRFIPGPNYYSSDPSVVNVSSDGLHLKITQANGHWQCGEVYLLESLGYGTYTVQVSSRVDNLDQNTVAAPLDIYPPILPVIYQRLTNQYYGGNGIFQVLQVTTKPGNLTQYVQPAVAQFTSQMEWRADHVKFAVWNGWSNVPTPGDIIYEWTYTGLSGTNIPTPGFDRVHINLWLIDGSAPVSGIGDEMIIRSFTFQP